MKLLDSKMTFVTVLVVGIFIGFIKGEEARNKWVHKMKNKQENKKQNLERKEGKVVLDDFEISSFHQN